MGFLDNTGLTTLWSKITSKISSMISAEAGKMIPYGYCQTASATKAKTVTVSPAVTELTTGLTIAVRFQYANGVADPTLAVNGLTAKAIKRYGTTAPSTSASSSWNANEVRLLTYNGSYWMLADWNNTTYSGMSASEISAGTSTTNRLISPANLKTAIETWSTGGTEVDPVFTASPAYGITSTDISNWNSAEANVKADWNESSSTSDAFIQNKPIYFGTCSSTDSDTVKVVTLSGVSNFSLEAGVRIAVHFSFNHNGNSARPQLNVDNTGATNVCFGDGTQTPSDERLSLCGWYAGETVFFEYSGSTWVMLTSAFAMIQLYNRDMAQADWDETDGSSLSYINHKPNVPVRVYGTTATKTPTEVINALTGGNIVEIVHEDQTFSFLTFFSFNYSLAFGAVISNTLVEYNGATYLYTLVGYTSTDTWSGSATAMAKSSDIPTVPTNVSSFTNDAGYLTSYTETDPTVPSWAKASTKPSYTASEVGALATTGGTLTGDTTLEGTGKVLNLKSAVATNSPILRFQRGELNDNYNDWQIQDRSGFLYFDERGNGSTAWTNRVCFNTSGNVQATSFNNYTLAGACAKAVDTSISAGSTSTNLPTSQAVASFVGGKMPFRVTLSYDSTNDEYSVDKTETEIENAILADRYVYLYDATGSLTGDYHEIIIAPLHSWVNSQAFVYEFETRWRGLYALTYQVADDGVYAYATMQRALPNVTSSDNGKVLRVVSGAWSAVSLPSASGVSF